MRLWAEDALADGEKLPKPRSIEAVRADPEVAAALAHGAVLAIAPLVRDKANLSLDAGLLAAIDEASAARGLPSRPGEFHPEPLTEPDLTLSRHPARATARRLPPSIEHRVPPVAG
jgi:hypothetical protein